jgi:hypothetical protein
LAPNNCDLCGSICGTGSAYVCQNCASKSLEVQPNSAQQLKLEIALLVTKWDNLKSDGIITPRAMYHNFLFEVMGKLRQLSSN